MGKVCVWSIRREGEDQLQHSRIIEWRPHETAITSLSLHTFPEEPGRAAEMWTSSADHTVQLHTFDPSFTAAIQITEPALRLRIPHPDLVRCVVPEYEHMLLFTGSADEQVRIWDLEELLQSPPPQKRGWTEDKNTALFERAIVAQVDEHYHDVHM